MEKFSAFCDCHRCTLQYNCNGFESKVAARASTIPGPPYCIGQDQLLTLRTINHLYSNDSKDLHKNAQTQTK